MRTDALKALVIDDHKTMRSIVRGLLRQLGVTNVEEADSGSRALDMLVTGKTQPDFILCDLHMEGGDGIEFINSLRRDERLKNKNFPVILLTGEEDKMLLDVSRQVGAVAVLPKPCSSAALAKAIGKAVGFDLATSATGD